MTELAGHIDQWLDGAEPAKWGAFAQPGEAAAASASTSHWGAVLQRMGEELEPHPWGRPATLSAFAAPDLARLPSEGTELGTFAGKPREELRGVVAPEWAAALVLSLEARGSTRADILPASDPKAGELRVLLAVTRSGEEWSYLHLRHEPTGWLRGSPLDGVLPATLRRVMQLPLRPEQSRRAMTIRQYLGAVAARNVREQMDAIYGDVPDLPDVAQSPVQLLRDAVVEDSGATDGPVREWVNTQVALRTTLAVGWAALGRGESSPDVDAATLTSLFAPPSLTGEISDGRAAELTQAMGAVTAGLTWQGLAATHSGRQFLPPRLQQHLAWCGDDLVGLEVGTNVAPDLTTELHRIADRAGVEVAWYLHNRLDALGWSGASSARANRIHET